jgi:ABC-type uncharacterized transport system substrate-binding protein
MRRRDLLALTAGAAALPSFAAVAEHKTMPVIGWLAIASPEQSAPFVAAFLQGLREMGYVEGRNVTIKYCWAYGDYDRLPALAADLVARRVDVLVAGGGTPSALAAKSATSAIPIVFVTADDPVAKGFVASLARPGGNLTGVSVLGNDLVPKQLELLTELVPAAKVVALLVNPGSSLAASQARAAEKAAKAKAVMLKILKAGTEPEIEAALASTVELHAGALIVGGDPFFISRREKLVALAARQAVPTVYPWRISAGSGGLISYGPSLVDALRQVGVYAGKILKGAKPTDLPVEQPTRFELVINLKTAKALSLTVPQSLLQRADEVIE